MASVRSFMKTKQTAETNAVKWGKAVGYGIAIGTVLGTVAGVATKNAGVVYVGICLGGAIGLIFKSKQAKNA